MSSSNALALSPVVRDIAMARKALKQQRREDDTERLRLVLDNVKDITVAILRNPTTGMLAGVVATKLARRANILSDVDAALIGAVIISATALQSFRPLAITGVG